MAVEFLSSVELSSEAFRSKDLPSGSTSYTSCFPCYPQLTKTNLKEGGVFWSYNLRGSSLLGQERSKLTMF